MAGRIPGGPARSSAGANTGSRARLRGLGRSGPGGCAAAVPPAWDRPSRGTNPLPPTRCAPVDPESAGASTRERHARFAPEPERFGGFRLAQPPTQFREHTRPRVLQPAPRGLARAAGLGLRQIVRRGRRTRHARRVCSPKRPATPEASAVRRGIVVEGSGPISRQLRSGAACPAAGQPMPPRGAGRAVVGRGGYKDCAPTERFNEERFQQSGHKSGCAACENRRRVQGSARVSGEGAGHDTRGACAPQNDLPRRRPSPSGAAFAMAAAGIAGAGAAH